MIFSFLHFLEYLGSLFFPRCTPIFFFILEVRYGSVICFLDGFFPGSKMPPPSLLLLFFDVDLGSLFRSAHSFLTVCWKWFFPEVEVFVLSLSKLPWRDPYPPSLPNPFPPPLSSIVGPVPLSFYSLALF